MLQLLLCHKKSFSMLGGELALSAVSKGTHYFAGFHALFQPGCKLNVCFGQYPQVWKVESCVVLASINRSPDWSRRCHEHGSTAPFLCTSCRKAPQWCRGRCKRSSLKIRWCSKAPTVTHWLRELRSRVSVWKSGTAKAPHVEWALHVSAPRQQVQAIQPKVLKLTVM